MGSTVLRILIQKDNTDDKILETNLYKRNKIKKIERIVAYGIHIFYSLKISNKNILKNILEI